LIVFILEKKNNFLNFLKSFYLKSSFGTRKDIQPVPFNRIEFEAFILIKKIHARKKLES
jgi:hypothetical protein